MNKYKIWKILDFDDGSDYFFSKFFDILIMVLIILNTIVLIIETEQVFSQMKGIFRWFEIFSVTIFSIEYFGRLICCNHGQEGSVSRKKFIFNAGNIIDLLAILPFFLSFLSLDLRALRVLRLMRIFRLVKIAKYAPTLKLISDVIKESISDLLIISSFIFILIIMSANLLFSIESIAQPDQFKSMMDSIWWAFGALTKAKINAPIPITFIGNIIAAVVSLLGLGFVALPAAVVTSRFIKKLNSNEKGS